MYNEPLLRLVSPEELNSFIESVEEFRGDILHPFANLYDAINHSSSDILVGSGGYQLLQNIDGKTSNSKSGSYSLLHTVCVLLLLHPPPSMHEHSKQRLKH